MFAAHPMRPNGSVFAGGSAMFVRRVTQNSGTFNRPEFRILKQSTLTFVELVPFL